jgi:ribonuclease HI
MPDSYANNYEKRGIADTDRATLTDAEREAIQKALKWALNLRDTGVTADSLRSILERLT